jgi:hypothetical protein
METNNRIRIMGLLGIAGGLLWIAAFLIQMVLPQSTAGPLAVASQALFPLALMGTVATTLGLDIGGAVRGSRFGTIVIKAFLLSQLVLIVGILSSLGSDGSDSPLIGLGGIASNIGLILTGIAVVTARRWDGWSRYAPLVAGAYVFFGTFLPSVVANQDPPMLALILMGVMNALVGVGLIAHANRPQVGSREEPSRGRLNAGDLYAGGH